MFLGSTRVLDQCDFINIFGKLSVPFFIPFSVFLGKYHKIGKMGPFLDWELLPYQVAKLAKLKSLRDDRPRELR